LLRYHQPLDAMHQPLDAMHQPIDYSIADGVMPVPQWLGQDTVGHASMGRRATGRDDATLVVT